MKTFLIEPKDCLSTHGGAGYAPGSYYEDGAIICGLCGTRIENPNATGYYADGSPKYGQAVSKQPERKQHKFLWWLW